MESEMSLDRVDNNAHEMLGMKHSKMDSDTSRNDNREMLMVDPSLVSGTVDSKILPVNLLLADGTVVSQIKIDPGQTGNLDLQALQSIVPARILINLESEDGDNREGFLQLNDTHLASNGDGLQLENGQATQMLVSNINGELVATEVHNTNSFPHHLMGNTTTLLHNQSGKDDKSPKKHRGGWPKGKKRKPEKVSNAPKPPASAYCHYTLLRRPKLREENPNIPFAEQVKIMGKEWSSLPEDEKQKYFEMAANDKKRYVEELKKYQENDGLDGLTYNSTEGTVNTCQKSEDDILHCNICDMYFNNNHNKTEHLLGAKHLNNVTKVQMKKREEKAKEEQSESGSAAADAQSNDSQVVHVQIDQAESSSHETEALDVNGFMLNFMQKHKERELELQHLRTWVQVSQRLNSDVVQKIHEHKVIQEVLAQELSTLRTYGSALSTQIDALMMVPALFGVLHNTNNPTLSNCEDADGDDALT